jgi:hypothetical protein
MWTNNKAFFLVIALLAGALGVESARSLRAAAGDAPPPMLEHHAAGLDAAVDGGAGR